MEFTTTINAPKEKVWSALWDKANYEQWVAAFAEGSTAVTDNWKEGSKVLFTDATGKGGMVSMVAANKPNEFMSFRHIGILKDGVEDTESEEATKWGDGIENYTLTDVDGGTQLHITLTADNMPQEFVDYFIGVWPKALDKVKEIAEKN